MPPANFGKAFAIGVSLNAGFVVLEVVFGITSNSVALLSDAGHNASDALDLAVSCLSLNFACAGAVGLAEKRGNWPPAQPAAATFR